MQSSRMDFIAIFLTAGGQNLNSGLRFFRDCKRALTQDLPPAALCLYVISPTSFPKENRLAFSTETSCHSYSPHYLRGCVERPKCGNETLLSPSVTGAVIDDPRRHPFPADIFHLHRGYLFTSLSQKRTCLLFYRPLFHFSLL
ncbi:hypothetical protein CEXT_736161 [Caerostris extrusa]|uniref:Uncharacterized protein n=1 Tax=Caerostris extrusa TaxID=172846 RepID=A0AAV4MY29_CAEEX|nr:hypothetical protein CEXT_736161 [Caerostris extrusa]